MIADPLSETTQGREQQNNILKLLNKKENTDKELHTSEHKFLKLRCSLNIILKTIKHENISHQQFTIRHTERNCSGRKKRY